jgi:hypothetical protein
MKPNMTSKPQQFRRKMFKNSECETLTQRRRRGKACRYSNDLLGNVTPIKSPEGKHSLGLVQGIASVDVRANKDAVPIEIYMVSHLTSWLTRAQHRTKCCLWMNLS